MFGCKQERALARGSNPELSKALTDPDSRTQAPQYGVLRSRPKALWVPPSLQEANARCITFF